VARYCFGAFCLLACAALSAANPVRAEPPATALCLYDSKSYSDGAFICAQKSLMLMCSSDGGHAMWKVVTDKDLGDRCTSPIALGSPILPRRRARWAHHIRHSVRPATEASAKCFSFNGKQYCE